MNETIFIVKDVLTKEECIFEIENINKKINDSAPHHSFVHTGNFHNQKSIDKEKTMWMLNKLNQRLPIFPSHLNITGVSKYVTCACYLTGQNFGLHTDTGIVDTETQSESKCTLLIYLNDDFKGGETVFYDDNFQKTTTIAPKAGSALFFDIALWHEAQRIVAGKKYWIGTELMTLLAS